MNNLFTCEDRSEYQLNYLNCKKKNLFKWDSHPRLMRLENYSSLCPVDKRLSWKRPATDTVVSLQPGLYQATYSLHGVELLDLRWSQSMLTLVKITGDENVPSGKVSVRVDLSKPLKNVSCNKSNTKLLNDEEMASVRCDPARLDIPDASWPPEWHGARPESCPLAFMGCGQIAWTGYYYPRFTEGNFLVLNEITCAFLWLELDNNLIVFKKISSYDENKFFSCPV